MEVPMKRTDTAKPQEKFLLFIQRPRSLPVYWKRNAGKLCRIFLKKEGGLIRVSGKPLPKIFPVDHFCSCRFIGFNKSFGEANLCFWIPFEFVCIYLPVYFLYIIYFAARGIPPKIGLTI